jgi:hypothetical protein
VKNQKLLEAIDKFAVMAEVPITRVSPGSKPPMPSDNEAFQQQRERLAKFYEHFNDGLRRVRNELGNDFANLKERGFDRQMLKLFAKVYDNVLNIFKEMRSEKPYGAAEKLASYVLDKPNAPYIDNLDFLGKHHLLKTNVDFKAGPVVGHPELRGLDDLKRLAHEARGFMERFPLLKPLSPSNPPIGFGESMKDIPAWTAGKDDKTKG